MRFPGICLRILVWQVGRSWRRRKHWARTHLFYKCWPLPELEVDQTEGQVARMREQLAHQLSMILDQQGALRDEHERVARLERELDRSQQWPYGVDMVSTSAHRLYGDPQLLLPPSDAEPADDTLRLAPPPLTGDHALQAQSVLAHFAQPQRGRLPPLEGLQGTQGYLTGEDAHSFHVAQQQRAYYQAEGMQGEQLRRAVAQNAHRQQGYGTPQQMFDGEHGSPRLRGDEPTYRAHDGSYEVRGIVRGDYLQIVASTAAASRTAAAANGIPVREESNSDSESSEGDYEVDRDEGQMIPLRGGQ